MVAAVGHPEDGIGDVAANQLGDGLNHTFFSADDQLIDIIQLVGFLLCLHLCRDGGENAIGDSQLCFLRFDSMMSTMCLLDGGTHYHWEAHRILQ